MNRRTLLIVCSAVLSSLILGCPPFVPVPPAEAVLAGTWAVTVENAPNLNQLLVTFDQNGDLDSVQYQLTGNAAVTAPSPVGDTLVQGSAVTISATFNQNTFSFSGTLNGAQTVATGTLTTYIAVGNSVVSINNGAATLTKQ